MSGSKTVLVFSYFFPPAGNVGVHRTLRFLKWLPAYGWNPIVLTPANAKVPDLDESLLVKVSEDLPVFRTHSVEKFNKGKSIDANSIDRPSSVARSSSVVSKFRERSADLLSDLRRYVSIPDEKRGWVRSAVRDGATVIERHSVDAIYVTGKPFSSYLIGEALSRRTGVPWIMDLRDLWTLNARIRPRSPLHGMLERRLERRLLQSAATVVVNTPGNRMDFLRSFPECSAEKFVTITNGFDTDDFEGLPQEKFEKFTIAYSGTFYFDAGAKPRFYRRVLGLQQRRAELYDTYSPKYLFQAVARLIDMSPEMRDRVEIVITGPGCEKAKPLVKEYGLEQHVNLLGWLDYRASLAILRQSHVVCLTLSRGKESEGWIPSKLFQYLGSGTPILALAPKGDVAEIIHETGNGDVVPPDDVDAIAAAVSRRFEAYRRGESLASPNWDLINRYEGRQLTARLAQCLDQIVERDVTCLTTSRTTNVFEAQSAGTDSIP